ncbi:hypothetical protein V6Z11_D05G021400 [Gossypium hirsutum]
MQQEHNHSCHYHHHHPEKLQGHSHSHHHHHHHRHFLPCMLWEHSQIHHCHHNLHLHASCTMKQQPWKMVTFSLYCFRYEVGMGRAGGLKMELWFISKVSWFDGGLCLGLNYSIRNLYWV